MIHLIYTGAVSCCFELNHLTPYYAPGVYSVYLNGEKKLVKAGKEGKAA